VHSDSECEHRRDADLKHTEEFNRVVYGAKKDYFDDVYGDKQIHLELLATHTDYQKRGAGSMLMRWGLQTAEEEGRIVTLIASPGAVGFYAHLRFATIFNLTIQLEGESEKVQAIGMRREKASAPTQELTGSVGSSS